MSLRNEILEGLYAANAAQRLIYNPQDDYYQQAAEMARRQNEIYKQAKKNIPAAQGGGAPNTPVPTTSSTGSPGQPAPNQQQAMPWAFTPQGPVFWPGGGMNAAAKGGRIQRFQEGGSPDDTSDDFYSQQGTVHEPTDEEQEADLIVKGILARDQADMARRARGGQDEAAARDARTRTSTPPTPARPEDQGQREAVNRQLPEAQAIDTSPPKGLRDNTARSRAGEFIDRNFRWSEDPRTQAGFEYNTQRRINEQRVKAEDNPLEQLTPEQREERQAELARLDADQKILDENRARNRGQAIDAGPPPTTPKPAPAPAPAPSVQTPAGPVTTPPPAPTPPPGAASAANVPAGGPQPPAGGPPAAGGSQQPPFNRPLVPGAFMPDAPPSKAQRTPPFQGAGPDMVGYGSEGARLVNPNQVPGAVTPPATQTAPPPPATANGPGTTGTSGPGTGAGQIAPPPSGTTSEGTPRMPGDTRPDWALGDPRTRGTAFDPTQERGAGLVNPDSTGVAMNTGAPPTGAPAGRAPGSSMADQPGGSSNNAAADYAQLAPMLAGARSISVPGPDGKPWVGQKAVSRPVFQAFIKANDQGGTLTPGTAMIQGMLKNYYLFTANGMVDDANKMALGIVQAANIEASAYGAMAIDQLRRGDVSGAIQSVSHGADYMPDGMIHRPTQDGLNVETVDPKTGKVTATHRADGRWILAAATGLKNGDLLWQTLNLAAAQTAKKAPGSGEDVALKHLIRMEQLRGLRQRNDKRAAAGTGVAISPAEQRVKQLLGEGPSAPPQRGGPASDDLSAESELYRDPG